MQGRAPPVLVEQKDDPRLRRLAGAQGSGVPGEAAVRRQIRAAQVVDEEEEEESQGEQEEQRQRDALLRRAQVSTPSASPPIVPPQKTIQVSRACGAERPPSESNRRTRSLRRRRRTKICWSFAACK